MKNQNNNDEKVIIPHVPASDREQTSEGVTPKVDYGKLNKSIQEKQEAVKENKPIQK